MVVNVVVSECSLSLGELKVLPPPAPSVLLNAPPPVVLVSALLWPASLYTVSGLVARVGAALLLLLLCVWLSWLVLRANEPTLPLSCCGLDTGVEKESWPSALLRGER